MQQKLPVLVTGASGFIAAHCILALLTKDYAVRGTIGSKSHIEKCQALIKEHYPGNADIKYAIASLPIYKALNANPSKLDKANKSYSLA